MDRIKKLPEKQFIQLFFLYTSSLFLIAAFLMPDRGNMLRGFWSILCSPTKLSANFFAIGGYAGTFLNMALIGFISAWLHSLPGGGNNNPASVLVHLLTIGFAACGLNVLNIWPNIMGVVVYGLVKKKPLGSLSNAMLFITGLAPPSPQSCCSAIPTPRSSASASTA